MAENRNDDNPRKGGQGNGDGNNGRRPPQPFMPRGAMPWILLGVLAVLLFVLMNRINSDGEKITWTEFSNYAKQNKFTGPITIKNTSFEGEISTDGQGTDVTPESTKLVVFTSDRVNKPSYLEQLQTIKAEHNSDLDWKEDPGESMIWPLLLNWGPFIVLLLLIYFFVFRSIRNAGGGAGMLGSFGRSRHKVTNKETSNVTLSDVAGIQEAKEEVTEIIEFLKNPKKFQRLGGRVPRGVLLIGEPGCGKTLLAKAVAGEAEVPFFSISGSDFVEMFVGVGASRVRDLFKQAKDSSPCIIFLDEIDAVGRRRGSGFSSGGHDEREQTLNAILVEMDGFDTSDQIIVMAATNRSDVLDPALTRPGRFDRQINVPLPDLLGRVEILKVHAKRVKMGPDVNLERLARGTPMFSGADLAAIINEAAIGATLQNKDFVEQDDLEEARDKVRWGRARKSQKVEEEDRVLTAYHESGHAVIQYLLPEADPLHKVSIIPRGPAGGATFSLPEKDRHYYGRKHMLAQLRILCAGRIAEEKKIGDVSSGAAMDIRMATSFARAMVLEYGMSDKLGFVNYRAHERQESFFPEKDFSDRTAQTIDEEVKRFNDEAYADTQRLVDEQWDKVVAVAEALLKHETLSGDEVAQLMEGKPLDKPSIGDLLKAEQDKSAKPELPKAKEGPAEPDAPGAMPSPA